MTDIGRIFWKDLRRFWPLALAAAVIAFFLAFFPAIGLNGSNSSLLGSVESLRWIVIGLLVVAVVQEDLVVSDRAAWITRPMKAPVVLAAKLLFLLVGIVVPFGIITAAGSHAYNIAPGICVGVGGAAAVGLFFSTALFALLGAITPSLLSAVITFVCCAAAQFFLIPYLSLIPSGDGTSVDLGPIPQIIEAILLVAVLGYHYQQRRLCRTAMAAIVAVIAAFALVSLLGHLCGTSRRPKDPAQGVTFVAKPPRGFVGAVLTRSFPLSDQIVVGMQVVPSFPGDADYYISTNRASFTSTDGRTIPAAFPSGWIPTNDFVFHGINTVWNIYPQTAWAALGVRLKANEASSIRSIMALPGATFEKFRGAKGMLEVSFFVSKSFVGDQGTLPREVGATAFRPGGRLRIESIQFASGRGLEIVVRSTTVNSSLVPGSYPMFALINEKAREVSLAESGHYFAGYAQSYLLHDEQIPLLFAHRWRRGSEKIESGIGPDWLKSARLEYFSVRYKQLANVEWTVPDFAMPSIGGVQ